MNRDELLETCGYDPDSLPPANYRRVMTQTDETNPNVTHTRAVIGWEYLPVLVRRSFSTGADVAPVGTTLRVAAILYLADDPETLDQGFGLALLLAAQEEAATHLSIAFAAVQADDERAAFFEEQGYRHPEGAPDGFLVCSLKPGIEWPEGLVRPMGRWT